MYTVQMYACVRSHVFGGVGPSSGPWGGRPNRNEPPPRLWGPGQSPGSADFQLVFFQVGLFCYESFEVGTTSFERTEPVSGSCLSAPFIIRLHRGDKIGPITSYNRRICEGFFLQ